MATTSSTTGVSYTLAIGKILSVSAAVEGAIDIVSGISGAGSVSYRVLAGTPKLMGPFGAAAVLNIRSVGGGVVTYELPPRAVVMQAMVDQVTGMPTSKMMAGDQPMAQAPAVKTASYTMVGNDGTLLGDATAGAITFTLPDPATCPGKPFNCKKVDASVNAVTVSGSIDGGSSMVLAAQWDCVTVQSTGIDYVILSRVSLAAII